MKCACWWERIAFGLGINKAAVRAVIHSRCRNRSSSITRRRAAPGATARRPIACCCGRSKDAGLLAYFIDQLTDPAEKESAWQRYHAVRRFAESGSAAIGRSACISARRRNGNPARCATSAERARNG